MSADASNYYLSRRPRLLREFDSYVETIRPVLGRYFADDLDRMIAETRLEYEVLIPQLPYIGGKQPLTRFLMYSALWLAVYRTANAHGRSLEEVGVMIYEICRAFLRAYPKFVCALLGFMNFSAFYQNRLRARALQSHLRAYPGDYVYDFIPGDGRNFDYGVDYLECASCKFLAAQGASELGPYLCPVDILYSEALGWGLQRTMTLAEGAEKCDFRFKKGGPTRVAVPPGLREVVSRKASG
jgi:hypothetical protein